MSKLQHDFNAIKGPLLIKIETCRRTGKNRKCYAECNEECPQKSYTIFDPKPFRRKSKSIDSQREDSIESYESSSPNSSTSHKKQYSKSSSVKSIHIQQTKNVPLYMALNTVKSKQLIYENPKTLEYSVIQNTFLLNIGNNMARNSENREEMYRKPDQKIIKQQTNPEDKYISPYSETAVEIAEQCMCSSFLQDEEFSGQKKNISENTKYPRKNMKSSNKNAIQLCNTKSINSEHMTELSSSPQEYTIEISVELAQNKKPTRKKPAHPEHTKKFQDVTDSNEATADEDDSFMKSPKIKPLESEKKKNLVLNTKSSSDVSDVIPQDKDYIVQQAKYEELENYQKVDCPMRIAAISDRRSISTRKSKSKNQPDEISISLNTSLVEISDRQGNIQTVVENKKTKIRSIYSERENDFPVETRQNEDHSNRPVMKSSEGKSMTAKQRAVDSPHSQYQREIVDESPQYMDYSDSPQKKFTSQNEQFPVTASRDSTGKQTKGSVYNPSDFGGELNEGPRQKKMKLTSDDDAYQPERFSVISEMEEAELYDMPESRRITTVSEPDEHMMGLFESRPATEKPAKHFSIEHEEQIDPDAWALNERDIVEKRKALFEAARALSEGLLEKARALSAAAHTPLQGTEYEKGPASTSERVRPFPSKESPENDYKIKQQPKFRSIGVSESSPMSLTTYINKDERSRVRPAGLSSQPEEYQEYDDAANVEKDRDSKSSYRPSTKSALPEEESELKPYIQQQPKFRSIGVPTTPPQMSYTSFKERWPVTEQQNIDGDPELRKQYPSLSSAGSSRYPSNTGYASTHPEGYHKSEMPSVTTERDKSPPSKMSSKEGPSAESSRYPSQRSGVAAPGSEGYQKSEIASRTTERSKSPPSNIASEYEPSVRSSRYPSQHSGVPAPRSEGYPKSETASRTTERSRGPPSNVAPEYEPSVASSRYTSQRSGVAAPRSEGYPKSETASRTTERSRGPQSNIASEYEPSVASSRYTSKRSAGPEGYQKSGSYSTNIAQEEYPAPGYRTLAVSTFSETSLHSYIQNQKRPKVSSPAASVQPMRYQESNVGKDRDAKSNRPTSSALASSEFEGDQKSVTSGLPPLFGTTVVPQHGKYPKNICVLETCVLQRHIDGCKFKKKKGEEGEKFCGYDVLSRQVFQTCLDSSEMQPMVFGEDFMGKSMASERGRAGSPTPTEEIVAGKSARSSLESERRVSSPTPTEEIIAGKSARSSLESGRRVSSPTPTEEIITGKSARSSLESGRRVSSPSPTEEVIAGKSAVSSLQSGRSKRSSPAPTEDIISRKSAAPVYSEKKKDTVTDSIEEEIIKPSDTESVASEVTTPMDTEETDAFAEESDVLAEETDVLDEETDVLDEETDVLAEETDVPAEETDAFAEETDALAEDDKTNLEDAEKTEKISDTDTYVSSVTSKKSSYSGTLPNFRNMPVQAVSIDRRPTSVFNKWFGKKK